MRDYVSEAILYAEAVATDNWLRPIGNLERLRCVRFLESLEKNESDKYEWYFDINQANEACLWLEQLKHYKGRWATENFKMIAWQILTVVELYGWRYREDISIARFIEAVMYVARGNGKSFMMAGIALYDVFKVGGPGAEAVSAATTGKQAMFVMNAARGIVNKGGIMDTEPYDIRVLTEEIRGIDIEEGVEHKFYVVNSRSEALDGLNIVTAIVDELHAHKDTKLYDVLDSSLGKVPNGKIVAITTAGFNQDGIAYEKLQSGEKILKGKVSGEYAERSYIVAHCLDRETIKDDKGKVIKEPDDPYDIINVEKANPLFSFSPTLKNKVKYELEAAVENKSKRPGYETKRCNIFRHGWEKWIDKEDYEKLGSSHIDWEFMIKKFKKLWIGSDLSNNRSFATISLLGYDVDMDIIYISSKMYLPKTILYERAKKIDIYRMAKDHGNIIETPGDMIDQEQVEHGFYPALDSNNVRMIFFDHFSMADRIAVNLVNLYGDVAGTVRWSASNITQPAKEFEDRVATGRLRHEGDFLSEWMVSNAVVDRRIDGSLLPKKENEASPKTIDVLHSSILAIAAWLNDEASHDPDDASFELIGA